MHTADLVAQSPEPIDLRDPDHLDAVDELAHAIFVTHESVEAIDRLDRDLTHSDAPLAARLAAKIARSRAVVDGHADPVRITVVIAMYAEHERLLPPSQHAHGEDALARKVHQLDTLLGDHPHWDWRMVLVDDGCPHGSGAVAEAIVRDNGWDDRIEVRYLQDGIDSGSPGVGSLTSTDDSRKGGSILYGMWGAAEDDAAEHVIVFTDADLSTHLGQIGSLAAPVAKQNMRVSVGSRREATSAVIKRGDRNHRGQLFIYLWKQILGGLDGVTDTQCGFKAFPADRVRPWVEESTEKQFAFDIELLLLAQSGETGVTNRVPVAWIDSDAASTTDDTVYLTMLQSVARMYREHLPQNPTSDEFADLVERLDTPAWLRLLSNVPEELLDIDPAVFDDHGTVVSARELAERSGIA